MLLVCLSNQVSTKGNVQFVWWNMYVRSVLPFLSVMKARRLEYVEALFIHNAVQNESQETFFVAHFAERTTELNYEKQEPFQTEENRRLVEVRHRRETTSMKCCLVVGEQDLLYKASCVMLPVLLFIHVSSCCMWHSAQSIQSCLLMITAKQLQGHSVLLGQGPASNEQCHGWEFVEVVAHKHFDSPRTTHCSVNLLKESNWTLVGRNAWGDFHCHVNDLVTWRKAVRERWEWVLNLWAPWSIQKWGFDLIFWI